MAFAVSFILILVILIGLYLFFKITKLEYKIILSILLIIAFLFLIGYLFELRNYNINYLTLAGLRDAFSIYFSWLFSVFDGVKFFTSNSVAVDYPINNSGF